MPEKRKKDRIAAVCPSCDAPMKTTSIRIDCPECGAVEVQAVRGSWDATRFLLHTYGRHAQCLTKKRRRALIGTCAELIGLLEAEDA